ncbi:MAG: glycerol kinase [Devosia sp.]|nr:glycerol kinase [Devosia sp.]
MIAAGIDQGTTGSKAALLDANGRITLLPGLRHRTDYPASGRVEQDPRELLANVQQLADAAGAAGARSLGLANQGETIVAWDRRSGEPIGPAIVWQDQRTSAAVDKLRTQGYEAAARRISGLPLDAYFSASKLAWVLDNIEDARPLAARGRLGLGTSDAYFAERLTGRYVTEPTTAGRTGLMNIRSCRWDAGLCELFGVPIELLPDIVDGTDPIGEITTPTGPLQFTLSLVDQVAALYGHGCRRPGDAKFTFGTGAFGLAITGIGAPVANAGGAITAACWQDGTDRVYADDGGVYSAGAAIEWLGRIGLLSDLAELDHLSGASAASRGLFFVPALSGLACPHWDRTAAGLWIGLDAGTERTDLQKAVLEGVAFRTAEVLDVLALPNQQTGALSIDGGLARSGYFVGMLASITGRTISVLDAVELTAVGTAEMALARALGEPLGRASRPVLKRRRVAPQHDAAAFRARFADARQRATGWRQ